MKERLAIVDGLRTPFSTAGKTLSGYQADDLGALPIRELMSRSSVSLEDVDEVILGNVAQPAHAANIARVSALKAGFPNKTPAYTVHRNCASGMESISTASNKIFAGEADIILAGGTESMSNIPFLFNDKMKSFFEALSRSKTLFQTLKTMTSFRLSHLKPVIGVVQGLTDPVCGLIMGITAENVTKEFKISRADQDQFALNSHLKAKAALDAGAFSAELMPVPLPPSYAHFLTQDDAIRGDQTLAALAKLKPYFDRKLGTVTVGNACPLTDGAAAVLLMSESKAKSLGLSPLGYLREYAYSGLEPELMGLGPVYATHLALQKSGLKMTDIDLFEINEAFAAQVLGCLAAFESPSFAQKKLNHGEALGKIDMEKLNINGGAIALGHPVGTTGTRLVITLLHALRRKGVQRGLATLCIGGGQGAAFILETE